MDARVVNQTMCKHGMIWEYCAYCQKVESTKMVKFPVDKVNEDGETERIWLRRKSKIVRYRSHRRGLRR